MPDTTLLALKCNNCGASITVQPGTRYVTCEHCGSQLEVHADGDAAYTQVIKQLEERTEKLSEDVEAIKVQNQLEELDRNWADESARLTARLGMGTSLGGLILTAILGGFLMGFAIFWMAMAKTIGEGDLAHWGIAFLIIPPVAMVFMLMKFMFFRQRRLDYERRRKSLAEVIEGKPRQDGAGA